MTDRNKMAKIALTFDAASMDPQVWPDVCQQISDYFGSEGALLAAADIGYDAGMLPYSEGVAGLMERYYAQKCMTPMFAASAAFPLLTGKVGSRTI